MSGNASPWEKTWDIIKDYSPLFKFLAQRLERPISVKNIIGEQKALPAGYTLQKMTLEVNWENRKHQHLPLLLYFLVHLNRKGEYCFNEPAWHTTKIAIIEPFSVTNKLQR